MDGRDVQARELEHHETLYSGFAQQHFAKPAVRAFRRHLATRIADVSGASPSSRVLSLGCGIGDTELLLAPRVGRILGVDLSPAAISQARRDAESAGAANIDFIVGDPAELDLRPCSFDIVLAVFFLHHLPDDTLDRLAAHLSRWLAAGGVFYSLDPSRYRLSGALGKLLVPNLMKKYQTPDERELKPSEARSLFASHGLRVEQRMYDFLSTPLAGLFPEARRSYLAARLLDNLLVRLPLLARLGSNFELLAHKL